jgi:hypothetical protein
MTHRVDDYLDGILEHAALSQDERAEAKLIAHVIEETRAFVDARPAPDLTAGVMRRIDQLGPRAARPWHSVLTALAGSLWTARRVSFQFRPAYGLLAAAVVLAFAVFSPFERQSRVDGVSLTSATIEPRLFVQFRLEAPDAANVRLAGSFTNWQPEHELYQTAPGIWTITLSLPPGVHDYAFIVDGERWVADPYAPTVDDGFGGTNSRIALVPPEGSRL